MASAAFAAETLPRLTPGARPDDSLDGLGRVGVTPCSRFAVSRVAPLARTVAGGRTARTVKSGREGRFPEKGPRQRRKPKRPRPADG